MRKPLIGLFCLLMVLMSLSACSSEISDKQLEKDILSMYELIQMDKINDLTILEKTSDTSAKTYKVSVTLESIDNVTTADITLNYVKTSGKWTMDSHTVKRIKVTPKNDPVLNDVMKKAITLPDNEQYKIHIKEMAYYSKSDYTILRVTRDFENAKAVVVVEESFHDDYWSGVATYTLDASYDFNLGWQFTLKDWTYSESMDWTGTYDITWDTILESYPQTIINPFYLINDTMVVTVTGNAAYERKMDGSYVDKYTVMAKTVFKGKSYECKVDFDMQTISISLLFDPHNQNTWMGLEYRTDLTGGRFFSANAGSILDESVTRRP